MKITLRFFGHYRELVGSTHLDLEAADHVSLAEVKQRILTTFPQLAVFKDSMLFAVNNEFGLKEQELQNGDEVAVLPPFGGGDSVEITSSPVSVEKVQSMVKKDKYGAVVTFTGTVRDNNEGHNVSSMEYEAFNEMAIRKMNEVVSEVRQRWQPLDIAIVHRTGKMKVGEVALVIAVGSAHRKEAFAACQYAIDRIKEIVPIWKKESRENGEAWVSG